MFLQVRNELKNKLSVKVVLLWFLFIVALIAFGMYRSTNYRLRDSLDLFSLLMDGVLIITFPILAALVYVASFAGEVRNRFLVYTRMRYPLHKTLYTKLLVNVMMSFLFFFMCVFIPFIFIYYIEPHVIHTVFKPSLYGLTTPELIDEHNYKRYTFTQLLPYGTFTYGFTYSLWVGLNGAEYAAIAFYLVLLIRNSFLALSLPYAVYIISTFVLGALKLNHFRPAHTVFPFEYTQSPLWTIWVPFIFLLGILILLAGYVHKNLDKVERLL